MAAFVLVAGPVGSVVAATVHVEPPGPYGKVLYTAAPGESNEVLISANALPQLDVTISDAGAVLTAGASCQALDEHSVRCSYGGAQVRLELGDANDSLRVTPTPAGRYGARIEAHGGPGDDVLDIRGAGYSGVLDGGGGHDQLYGGPWSDFLTDGDRDGARGSAGPGPDVLDAGEPTADASTPDVVSYQQRTKPVRVDLASGGVSGERGEGDIIRHVGSVIGGSAADHLAGTSSDNIIAGGRGRDVLIGRGGNDVFGSVPWSDMPVLNVVIGSRGDSILCGDGNDEIDLPGFGDYIRPDCETLHLGGIPQPAYPTQTGSTFTYTYTCNYEDSLEFVDNPPVCSGTVTVRETAGTKRLLARGRIPPDIISSAARLRLTPLGRRLATRPHGARATLRIRGKNMPTDYWTIRLKLRH